MSIFRPCIDLHSGRVKQIVGGSLKDGAKEVTTNFVSENPPSFFAEMYAKDNLAGGHVIKLGAGNDAAARDALAAYPNGLQVGGGVTADNAIVWLDAGASHVIVTSAIFTDKKLDYEKVAHLSRLIGVDRLVIDLSCRKRGDDWIVAKDKWQTLTDTKITDQTLDNLATYCDEFLIHAADIEGLCQGIDVELIEFLGRWGKIPITYAGGAKSLMDLETVKEASNSKVDLTIGSALDIFGGSQIKYCDCVEFNKKQI